MFLRAPDDVRPSLEDLPGTHWFVDDLEPVHGSDWNLLVVWGAEYSHKPGWHVLGFGIDRAASCTRRYESHARHAYVAPDIEGVADPALVQRSIVDVIAPPPRKVWRAPIHRVYIDAPNNQKPAEIEPIPLVCLGEEELPYALVTQSWQGSTTWALPEETIEHRAWVLCVLRVLHGIDPEAFPAEPDWQSGTTWSPPALLAAQRALDHQVATRDRVIAEANASVEAAERAVDEQRSVAADGPWRLLTSQGDELVSAVKGALESFGFTVAERDDEHHKRHGRRLEDLLVTDPTDPGWESLVEVKGYGRGKGASVNDVAQVLTAPSMYFASEHQRPPASVWHVVNAQAGTDPSARSVAIPNEKDLRKLTEAHGALIDTRDLFRAWCAATEGHDPASVRASLRAAVTRWTWPVEEAHE